MDEMNKLLEEENNEKLNEKETTVLKSANASEDIAEASKPVAKAPAPKGPRPKLPIIGGVIAGVVAIVVTVALIFSGNGGISIPDDVHEHSYGEWCVVDNPTCTVAGVEERICECGKNETRLVDALGHDTINHEAKNPTCNEIGWDVYVTCSRCDYTTYVEKASLGHSTYDGTCSKCNITLISSAEGLLNIGLDGTYHLLSDIDLGGIEWAPIGGSDSMFTGSFNGNGFVISNFKVTEYINMAGFFSQNSGTIENLGLENFTIDAGGSYAGGLVGNNYNGTITNCYATGTVYSNSFVGGLIGHNQGGSITYCYATGDVVSVPGDPFGHAGGLVGFNNEGVISNCYATGDVTDATCGGGFIGRNIGTIKNCYATGDVSANIAGGFASTNRGEITNCYSTGNVSFCINAPEKYTYAGGFVGVNGHDNWVFGVIKNSYATGDVYAYASNNSCYSGAFVGYEAVQGTINFSTVENSYFYIGQTITMVIDGITTYDSTNEIGTSADMVTLKSNSFHINILGWSADNWIFVEGKRPILKDVGTIREDDSENGDDFDNSGHIHTPGEWVIVKQPTCAENGFKKLLCSGCEEVLTENVILALGHTFGTWHEIPATSCCTESYSVRVCVVCMYVDYDRNIETIQHPHDFDAEIVNPTCTKDGRITITCKNCSVVGADETLEKLGHDMHYVANITTHTLTCQRTGCTYKENDQAHISSIASPCVDNTCTVCGYLIWSGIGHQFGNSYESDNEYHWPVCERKDCNITADKAPHSSVNAKCTDSSTQCDICGKTYVPKDAHIMGDWYVYSEATCTENEVSRRECVLCGTIEEKIGASLGHSYGSWYVVTQPTETKAGEEKRSCNRCGHSQTRDITPTGHHLGVWYVIERPTCTDAGEKRRDCLECDYYEIAELSAYGHYSSNWTVTKNPTCTMSGTKIGNCERCGTTLEATISSLGHSWSTYSHNSTHHWKTCSRCDNKGMYASHSGGGNSCTKGAECSACGYEYGTALGHKFESKYSYDEDSHFYICSNGCGTKSGNANHSLTAYDETLTTTDNGAEIRYTHNLYKKCDICGYHKIEKTIVGSEHYGCKILDYKAPTCTDTGLGWGWACAVPGCNDVYLEQEILPALGHNYVNGICTRCGDGGASSTPGGDQPGHVCRESTSKVTKQPSCTSTGTRQYLCSCGEVLRQETIPVKGHTEETILGTDATCTSTGLTDGKKCSVCGTVTQAQSIISMKDHTQGEWVTDKESTCTENGSKHKECTVCGKTMVSETISPMGHNEVIIPAEEATCTKTGLTEGSKCITCGIVTKKQNTVPVKDHTLGDWIIDKEAECTQDGTKHQECTVCRETVETSVIPMLKHSYTSKVTAPTCTEQGYTTYECGNCGDKYKDEYVSELGHNWQEPVFVWDEYSSADANFVCQNGHIETINATITSEIITVPTCTTTGEKKHTATVSFGEQSYSDIRIETLAEGHSWRTPIFTWTGYRSASAEFVCESDNTHTETLRASIRSITTQNPTCTSTGEKVHIATVIFNGQEYTEKNIETLPASHNFQYCKCTGCGIGLQYRLLSNGTYEVTGCTTYFSTISVPSTYNGKSVTAIGNYAFKGSRAKEIRLPSSVRRIGIGAMDNGITLEKVYLDASPGYWYVTKNSSYTGGRTTVEIGFYMGDPRVCAQALSRGWTEYYWYFE